MLGVHDVVLYGTEGACEITEIARKDFGAGAAEYYVLRPVYRKNATVFVPTQNRALVARMRRVLSAEEIEKIIEEMPGESCIWIPDESLRKEEYRKILAGGDSRELIRLVKTLYLRQKEQSARGRKLHQADERFLKEAEKVLYDQFALALKIQPDQVLPFILERIEGRGKGGEKA